MTDTYHGPLDPASVLILYIIGAACVLILLFIYFTETKTGALRLLGLLAIVVGGGGFAWLLRDGVDLRDVGAIVLLLVLGIAYGYHSHPDAVQARKCRRDYRVMKKARRQQERAEKAKCGLCEEDRRNGSRPS